MSEPTELSDIRDLLQRLYGASSVPHFELNESNKSTLLNLLRHSSQRDHDLLAIMAVERQQTEEYVAEAERMRQLIHSIGLREVTQTDETLANLVAITVDVADLLDVDDPTEANLDLAMAHLRLSAAKAPVQHFAASRRQESARSQASSCIEALSRTEALLRSIDVSFPADDDKMEAQLSNKIAFLREKQKEYSRLSEKSSMSLKKVGYRKEIDHSSIERLKLSLDEARKGELEPLRAKLKGYHGLPPNLDLAKAKVAQAEQELELLNEKLMQQLNALNI